jgi:hypothetical protein
MEFVEFDFDSVEFCIRDHQTLGALSSLNLPLLDVPLSRSIMRPSIAVPRSSVLQISSD